MKLLTLIISIIAQLSVGATFFGMLIEHQAIMVSAVAVGVLACVCLVYIYETQEA